MREFKRKILVNFSGVLGAQLATFISYPVLSRIYSPTEFGSFAQVMIAAQAVSIVNIGQLHSVIPFCDTEEEKVRILSACHELSLVLFILILAVMFGIVFGIKLPYYWLFLPLIVLTINLFENQKIWLLSSDNPGLNSSSVTINRVSAAISKALIPGYGLFIGEIIGNTLGTFITFKKKVNLNVFIPFSQILSIYKKKIHFCFFYTLYTVSILLNGEFLTWIVSKKFSLLTAGQFFLAQKLTFQSSALLGSVISMSIIPIIAKGDAERRKLFLKLLMILLPATALAFFTSFLPWQELALFFFGDSWGEVGLTLGFLVILIPVKTFTGVFSYILVGHNRTKFVSFFRLLQFVLFISVSYLADFTYKEFLLFIVIYELAMESLFLLFSKSSFKA